MVVFWLFYFQNSNCWIHCKLIGIILQPFIPEAAKKILDILNIDNNSRSFKFYNMKYAMKKSHPLNDAQPLFPRYNA